MTATTAMRKVNRCPMCHRVSAREQGRCSCGYEFGQELDHVLMLLRDQRRNARIMLGALIFGELLVLAIMVLFAARGLMLVIIGAVVFGATAIARQLRTLAITRDSLSSLESKKRLQEAQPALPAAPLPRAVVVPRTSGD